MESQKFLNLKQQYAQANTEKEKIDFLIDMTLDVRNTDAEKALVMAEQIIERSEKIGYLAGIGNGLNHEGACYWLIGDYEEGLDELTEAQSIAKEINDKSLEAKVLNNFGRIYRNLGDLAHALRDFEAALEMNEELGSVINQTINLTNISNLYYDLGDYDTALEYALKCMPIFEQYKDKNRLIAIYGTLGDIYFKKELFDKALFYFLKCHENTDDVTLSRSIANSGLGKVYFKLNNFEKAEHYLDLGLAQAKILNNPEAEIIAQFYKGRLYVEYGNYRKALEIVENALQLASHTLRKQDLVSIHEFLSELYEKMGDVPKAFHHLKTYEKLKEEIFQQATFNKLRNLQVKNQMVVAKKEKEVAERTAHLKQQFMANMSHEIRTPMNAIVGITRLLLEKEPKADQLKYLNAIKQSSDNLLVIVNDILDLSKIEAGKIVIEHIDFSFREMLNSIYEIIYLKAEQKNIQLKTVIADDIPDRLLGDPTRLNQILINLVGNAIKFTEKGHVTIHCTLKEQIDERNIILQFDIEDTGIGISKEYVEKIFESFTQAGTDTARKFGGTGLGLTISKQLVDLMHGEISVKSKLNEGTIFTVAMPIEIASEQEVVIKKDKVTTEIRQRLSNISILLVEDNEFNRLVAEDTLKSLLPEIKITIAENGEIAIQKLKEDYFDLILMDIQMPVMNGVDATRYIRTKMPKDIKDIKIIAMTANVLQEDVERYLNAGMDAYISKPFQTEELLLKMNFVLDGHKESNIKQEEKSIPNKKFVLPSQITDMAFLQQFTGGKVDKQDKYIKMFLENGPKLLTNIEEALINADYESIRIAAHSMKPQLSYMGVKEAVSNILLIEQNAASPAHHDDLPTLIHQLRIVCNQAFSELKNKLSV